MTEARRILRIAAPAMAGSLVETLYNLTDAFFLGKLGSAEISAPSVSTSLVFFLIIFATGLSGAGTTLIAQVKGRGDAERMNFYMNQTAVILAAASGVLTLSGLVLARPILRLLNTPPEVLGPALTYLRIVLGGMPFMFAYFLLQSSFSAIGDTVTPLKVHLTAVLANLVLDPLLIFGFGPIPALSVAGAAVATVLSQGLGAFLSLRILAKGRGPLRLRPALLRPDPKAAALILRIGLPSSVGQALSALGFTVLQGVVNLFGTGAIAAFGVGNRLIGLFDLPAHGLSVATTTLVGQALGARDEDRAARVVGSALRLCLVLVGLPLAASVAFGGHLVRFFVADPEAVAVGDLMFKVVAPSVLFFCLYLVLSGAFQGAGDTRVIMVLSVVRLWIVRVPLAYALAFLAGMGPMSIWIAMFVSNLATALAGLAWFRGGRWRKALGTAEL
ncbi:MAG TPA: MATE family efflux transporter [Spirochaetia bacterium]|nr:MATE family efflux transporter [Spirochaetales bacterium]HRY81619.1 MATE family efflux transporter [Spirochaetia bacterium]